LLSEKRCCKRAASLFWQLGFSIVQDFHLSEPSSSSSTGRL
jgi:hypothetical protein